MIKKFNNIINYTIVLEALFLLIGILLIIFPELSIVAISYVISIGLIVTGIFLIVYLADKLFFMNFFLFGVLQILLGVVILAYPKSFTIAIGIFVGIWMILKSITDFRFSLVLKKMKNKYWVYVSILSILAVICGIMLITNIEIGTITLTVIVGIFLFAHSLATIVDAIIFKRNVNDIVKELGFNK